MTTTDVLVEAGPGHPRVRLRSGVLAPRILATAPGTARIALVATTATLLGGDAVDICVRVDDGQRLELDDMAATVAYDGRGRPARWHVSVAVGHRATLVWRGEPLVVSDGAHVARSTRLDIAEGGRLLLRDVVVLGRHGERGGSLRCSTHATYAGAPLLVEQLELADGPDGLRCAPGVLGTARVVETITCVADPVPRHMVTDDDHTVRLDLAGPGLLARHLGTHAHGSPLATTWDRLSAAFGSGRAGR
ncbi:MAG TPA: urease accessory protein UreD [Intrasporangium sp.]|uniref:urease accessory protein UreD n=1 Tax=Intrasporangium sp. TaxID=1925024 RepID=UPI002D7A18F8|nr:urease accessory protein UreD [Intrasporangium sp.]HET7397324.1 urease accessory protein UreD [Intrasporangium sp.]